MRKYKTRITDAILKRHLLGKGAVLIEGLKWCGKTTTAEQIAGSILYMEEPSLYESLNRLAFLVCRGGWPRATDLERKAEDRYKRRTPHVRAERVQDDSVNGRPVN